MPRYEYVEGTSAKFWEIEIDGSSVTTRWGRLGTAGQEKTKTFASPAKAQAEYDGLIREKVGKGTRRSRRSCWWWRSATASRIPACSGPWTTGPGPPGCLSPSRP